MLDFEGLRAVAMMSAGTGRETLSSAMACEPTTDLDEKGAAGDRLGAPADGGRGMDSLASGANQPAAPSADPSADEIERIVQFDALTGEILKGICKHEILGPLVDPRPPEISTQP